MHLWGNSRHFWSGLFISNFLTITLGCGLKSHLAAKTHKDTANGAKKSQVAIHFLADVYFCG